MIVFSKAAFWKEFSLRKASPSVQQSLLALELVHWSISCLLAVLLLSWHIQDLQSHRKELIPRNRGRSF